MAHTVQHALWAALAVSRSCFAPRHLDLYVVDRDRWSATEDAIATKGRTGRSDDSRLLLPSHLSHAFHVRADLLRASLVDA